MPCAATWIDLETAVLSEVTQTEKDKYNMILWNLKKKVQMNLSTKQKYSYRCRKKKNMVTGDKAVREG